MSEEQGLDLGAMAKKVALNIGEDAAKAVLKDLVRPAAEALIQKSETKIDDLLLPFLDDLEKALLGQLDKIDGEEG